MKCIKEAPDISKFDGFLEFYKNLSQNLIGTNKEEEKQSLTFKDDPTVIFLGTGSMMPSTFRNVSSISLTVNNSSHILLDCGEGTFSQIIDSYGIEGIDDYLKNLRMIYITHIHPDHNLGLFKVLAERKELENRLKTEFEVRSLDSSQSSSSCQKIRCPFSFGFA